MFVVIAGSMNTKFGRGDILKALVELVNMTDRSKMPIQFAIVHDKTTYNIFENM